MPKHIVTLVILINLAIRRSLFIILSKKNSIHYFELAAMEGHANARFNLGLEEKKAGNWERALKHFMIAIRGGEVDSVNSIKQMYTDGHATKEDYMKALKLYQQYLGEIMNSFVTISIWRYNK